MQGSRYESSEEANPVEFGLAELFPRVRTVLPVAPISAVSRFRDGRLSVVVHSLRIEAHHVSL